MLNRRRVKLVYVFYPYAGGGFELVHYKWGWLPITIRTDMTRKECVKLREAYYRLTRIQGKTL